MAAKEAEEHSSEICSVKKDLAARADLCLARVGFVFLSKIASSICDWYLF